MNRVSRASVALFVAAALAHTAALADPQAAQNSSTDALTEVVVTGSRIKRDPVTAPTPLIQIQSEAILRSGLGSVIDVLADVPALSGSLVQEDTTGSFLNLGGLSLLNLRDLGTGRTLTLVDGRRHVGSAAGTLAVDVDTIPRLLIDRVEIITGANSALYGADAVSGAVNFVMRRDYEGIQVDAGSSMINKNGELNNRVSLLGGTNLFGDRLNVYGAYEREQNQEVRDEDMDWRAEAWGFLGRDFDPASAPNDSVVDNILVSGLRRLDRTRGGTLTLANDIAADASRNITAQPCPLNVNTTSLNSFQPGVPGSINANCIFIEPGRTYQFDNSGAGRLANFGTIRSNVGRSRSLVVGGDGLNLNTQSAQVSRVPEAWADRFQGGANFDLTESVQLFAEAKYVQEETSFETQQTFFDIGIVNQPANLNTLLIGSSAFNTGLDNAYLDPAVRTAILNNVRPVISSAGVQTGTVADPRARLSIFGPSRTQDNSKELMRYVVGVRGETESLGFINDLNYELSYTYGKLENVNREGAVDSIRFKHSADAVIDTLGRVNGKPGEIVCRVKLLAANGIAIPDQFRGGNYSPTNPEIANCVPSRVFGEGGYNQAALDFFGAAINVRQKNEQQDALGFVSGNLWDLWGAGPIGFALGAEYREEKTEGIGRSRDTGDRLLFLNTGADFLPAKYDTSEYFGELRLPLLKDMAFTRSLELGAAFRSSDYSTVGKTDTYSLNVVWRPIDDITLRATRGKAVRIPTLGENFAPASQTFANGFVDPCSATVIAALADTVVRANRQKNCVELGIPAGTVISYGSGIPGKNAGNPFLLPETSFTSTVSLVVTPRFLPKATLVLDYYEIEIKDVIASVSAQTAANQCVSEANLNPAICATTTRTGATPPGTAPAYGIIDFIQGSVNYSKLYTRGIDYQLFYRTDSNLSFRLSGNYLFDWRNHNNIARPETYVRGEGYVALPRTRFSLTTEWQPNEKLSLQWNADYQRSQYLLDVNTLGGNDDTYEDVNFYETGSFVQHDLSARFLATDNLAIRGGVVNALDKKPAKWLGNTGDDNFDLFGRRYFLGVNYSF
jgi:outer membrane receptor protein involved in Fe transport